MEKSKSYGSNLKSWDVSERPREKLLTNGVRTLSVAELLAILIGKGNRNENAVMLCQRILKSFDHDLIQLSKASVSDLASFKGIGEVKAISIVAALELGKRRQRADASKIAKITSSRDAYIALKSHVEDLPHEEFWILMLNRGNGIIQSKFISKGGVSGTVVDPKLIFKPTLEKAASGLILCHNHPSGNLYPSLEDIKLTEKISKAGELLDIKVLDHLIITGNSYYSFADEGKI
ncbi:RadC family protein [Membranihabitans marinus]|uniref:RadC family protein n=1 Tax=Membranihabitans marinus TaxID=1227546 RepID=UPI001F02D837|nr:DNA repair protein RadC [Membranihabitans marinus]